MSETLTIIGLIAKSAGKFINIIRYKIVGCRVSVTERIGKLSLKEVLSLRQFKTPFNVCCSLALICEDIVRKYRRTKNKIF